MERERSRRKRARFTGVGLVVAALVLAACAGEPSVPPTEDGPPGAGSSATGPIAACDELEPTYDPPPEEQPSGDSSYLDMPVDDGPAEGRIWATLRMRGRTGTLRTARLRRLATPPTPWAMPGPGHSGKHRSTSRGCGSRPTTVRR
jgi:hypothetical protein